MDSSQFGNMTAAMAATLNKYINVESAVDVKRETLRFIDDNFRMQGWQGATFEPWAPIKRAGTILVRTGALRRGINADGRGNGEVYFYNNMPYAKVHNEGFNGVVNVRSYSKKNYYNAKSSSLTRFTPSGKHRTENIRNMTGESAIAGHVRKMDIIQRQFAPHEGSESPVLNDAIIKAVEKRIINILKF
jgi:phage gpG-like protein